MKWMQKCYLRVNKQDLLLTTPNPVHRGTRGQAGRAICAYQARLKCHLAFLLVALIVGNLLAEARRHDFPGRLPLRKYPVVLLERRMEIQLSDIGRIIQLAIAPVFLLTGVGTMLVVLTNRLGRIIDRTRVLDDRLKIGPDEACRHELRTLHQRGHLINYAITLSTACGLLVCLIIAMLFLGDTTNLPLDQYVAALFVFAMIGLTGSFVFFLREILIGSRYMRSQQIKALRHFH